MRPREVPRGVQGEAQDPPTFYSLPLISAERSPIAAKIHLAVERIFLWIYSLLTLISSPSKKRFEIPPKRDIYLAMQKIQMIKDKRPNPIRFIGQSVVQAPLPLALSLFQRDPSSLIALGAKRAVDGLSVIFVAIADTFFPLYSETSKQSLALLICTPIVGKMANRLGYKQGYLFYIGIAINIFQLTFQLIPRSTANAKMQNSC